MPGSDSAIIMSDLTPVPHFFRLYRGDTVEKALARHRHYLWSYLSLKPGMNVLEIGSGLGTAAIELSHYAGVSVVGIENDSFKIEHSTVAAHLGGIQDRVSFIKGNIMELSRMFQSSSFDAVYAIESFKMTASFLEVYEQVQYVLKPGGKIASYDWCWTNTFDSSNPDHCRLATLVENSTNIGHRNANDRSMQSALRALERTGLRIIAHDDLADSEKTCIIPWYIHLRDIIGNPHASRWVFIDSFPQHAARYSIELTRDAASILQQAGFFKMFTPMAMFVAQKVT